MTASCHEPAPAKTAVPAPRIALTGAPNAGKTSVFNALTGLRAKTGNYPGVTVSRYLGTARIDGADYVLEDLPGTYSLEALSPDEQIAVDVLDGRLAGEARPDAALIVVDATTLRRSLRFVARVLGRGLPVAVVLTFTDELTARQGTLDVDAFAQALGVPAVAVVARHGRGVGALRDLIGSRRSWDTPAIPPPADGAELDAWIESVLSFAGYRAPGGHALTGRIDAVLLHPVAGTLVFLTVMVLFFQTIFGLAAPLQGWVEEFFGWLSGLVAAHVSNPWLGGLLGDALIGGVGSVLVFVPQIMLLFLLIALLEGVGYMSRAAFLMDRVMARAGLEGRAFVALLSSFACAIPGIMATRTLPSARDRLATMLAAPLMTCSARLPVYVLLIGMLVDPAARVGPFGAQGLIMFGLYLLGVVAAMLVAFAVKKTGGRRTAVFPFFMEMPPYRLPAPRSVLIAMGDSARSFIRKCATIIAVTTVGLWLMLNLPVQHTPPGDDVVAAAYQADHSYAASLGRFVAPVFAPLGFDWRINIGVLSAQSARETFVATLGQVAAAQDPENPEAALRAMTKADGTPLFSAPTIAALLVYFAFALQCMATVGVIRRETGTWRWPIVAFTSLTVLAWLAAFAAHSIVALF
jgi:ferrous iron transport protein B